MGRVLMPTLGKTTAGVTVQNVSVDRFWHCGTVTAPEDGTIDSIHFMSHISSGAGDALAKWLVYKQSDGSLIATGSEFTIVGNVAGWYTSTCAGEAFLEGDVLLICVHHEDPGSQNVVIQRDATAAVAAFLNDTYADGSPATFPGGMTSNSGPIAAYITYTAGGGSSVMPVMMQHYHSGGD
jgi:hypothetical protein